MRINHIFYAISIFLLSLPLFSQDNGTLNSNINKGKYNVNLSTQVVTIQGVNVVKSTTPANNVAAQKKNEDEEEYTEVMVDKIEYSNYGKEQNEDSIDKNKNLQNNPIPYSYGDLKGVFFESGRNILVFEGENGILTFISVSIDKNNKISWKLIYQINRI